MAIKKASTQWEEDRLDCAKRDRPVSVMWQCFLSEIPFSLDVYGHVNLCKIPFMFVKFLNIVETYSPPLLVWSYLIWQEKKFPTKFLNLIKHERISDFLCKGDNHEKRE
jgi:hypothetical protein